MLNLLLDVPVYLFSFRDKFTYGNETASVSSTFICMFTELQGQNLTHSIVALLMINYVQNFVLNNNGETRWLLGLQILKQYYSQTQTNNENHNDFPPDCRNKGTTY
jgi:hypothetical protein